MLILHFIKFVRAALISRTILLTICTLAVFPHPAAAQNVDELVLKGNARPDGYIDAIGRSAVWMGTEDGILEAWVWPYKIFHAFNLAARTGEVGSEIDLKGLARNVEIRPYSVQTDFVHSRFTIRQTLFADATEPVLVMMLDVDTSTDLTLVASFVPDLEPMWPAGMGGQYAFFDGNVPGYVLSESRGVVNAVVGTPDASRGSPAPAHQLSGASAFEIPVSRERAESGPILLVISGGREAREETLERYNRKVAVGARLLEERRDAWVENSAMAKLTLPRPELEQAYRWAVNSLVDGYQYTPGLGTGLVAGFGPTGSGYRPGFSWYFGGDTSINSFGLVSSGMGSILSGSLEFLEGFQRDDGKITHEISRSAGLIDWFGEYPYAFIHGDTTPFYIVATANYFRWTNDREHLERSWPHLLKAYEFGLWADEDGDGLMDNSRAGLGASELGSLREGLKTGVFIATVWTQALKDLSRLAREMGEEERAEQFLKEHERARARLVELFVDRETRTINFGVSVNNEPKNDATAWAAFPIVFNLIEGEAAENTLDMVASAEITTDWGTRMLSEKSPFYDPVGYNNGAVWLFLTGYSAMAEYAAGRRYSGYQHLRQVARTTWIDGRGRHPEVMSGDYFTALEQSVPHQLFSSSPIPANLVRGVLGIELDLPSSTMYVRPQLPGGWLGAKLTGYPLGNGKKIDIELKRVFLDGGVMHHLMVKGPEGLIVVFAPQPVPLERIADEGTLKVVLDTGGEARMAVGGRSGIDLVIDELRWGTVSEGPVHSEPEEGSAPVGLRIIRFEETGGDRASLTLEGRAGYTYLLPVECAHPLMVESARNGPEVTIVKSWNFQALQFTISADTGRAAGVDDYRRFTLEVRYQ